MKAITSEKKEQIKNKSQKSARTSRSESIYELAALGLLTAICFIMAFTPLGFIPIGVLTVTFMTIPVIVSATVLKPRDSAIIGGIFGITSFIKTVTGAGGVMMAGLFQINPFLTFILCIVPFPVYWKAGLADLSFRLSEKSTRQNSFLISWQAFPYPFSTQYFL